jgi:spore coat polysaccharide biosynthesis predicted glycosyltransferase SpsG
VFDDVVTPDLPVDLLINGAAGAERLPYTTRPGTRCLLGLQYFALRPVFQRRGGDRTVAPRIQKVLVTLGGDSLGLATCAAAGAAAAFPSAHLSIVLGAYDRPDGPWPRAAHVLTMPENFAELLSGTDLMLCGGGQTLYEAVACGIPAVGIRLGADQEHHLGAMARLGGCVEVTQPHGSDTLQNQLEAALAGVAPREIREMLSIRGRQLIDGLGAARIASALTEVALERPWSH